jgi:hypothetical protein
MQEKLRFLGLDVHCRDHRCSYRGAGSCIWYGLRRRQESISEEAKEIAWKAQTPAQSQQQSSQARRRILICPMQQAQSDSR